jgi:hypothetical protein
MAIVCPRPCVRVQYVFGLERLLRQAVVVSQGFGNETKTISYLNPNHHTSQIPMINPKELRRMEDWSRSRAEQTLPTEL